MEQELTFNKSKVLERVKTNREQHRIKVDAAWENYRAEIIEELDRRLDQAKNGKPVDPAFMSRFPLPEDYTRQYDRVIDMLEASDDPSITLSATEFNRWMRDEWEWQERFMANSLRYVPE